MRKTYVLENLGCANCAAKMENKIKKINGVNDATINYMTSKLNIEGEEEQWGMIMDEAAKICRKYESDCTIKM